MVFLFLIVSVTWQPVHLTFPDPGPGLRARAKSTNRSSANQQKSRVTAPKSEGKTGNFKWKAERGPKTDHKRVSSPIGGWKGFGVLEARLGSSCKPCSEPSQTNGERKLREQLKMQVNCLAIPIWNTEGYLEFLLNLARLQ